MSAYIKLETGEYPRHAGDIQLDPDGVYALVEWIDPPEITEVQRCCEGAPELVNGVWRMTWIVRTMTEQEIANIKASQAKTDAVRNPVYKTT